MSKRTVTTDDLNRLRNDREATDKNYNDALTALDLSIVRPPKLPPQPPAFDDHQAQALNKAWKLIPDKGPDLGSGWRRRLRGFIWQFLGPIIERQQHFNSLSVDHLNRNVSATIKSRESATDLISALEEHLATLSVVQSRLVQFSQQITPYVDTKNYEFSGLAQRASEDIVERVQQNVAFVDAFVDETNTTLVNVSTDLRIHSESSTAHNKRVAAEIKTLQGLSQSVEVLTSVTNVMKREFQSSGRTTSKPETSETVIPKTVISTEFDSPKYVAFENVFRGSRHDVQTRQKSYLTYFNDRTDVLDVGCGRGEFLDLLRQHGITAKGIDINVEMVEQCLEDKLNASVSDALEYLMSLDDESLGGVFSAQVVEHLDADYLMKTLDLMHQKLRPGSRIVLETINPACWSAFFSAFLRDITHRFPLHPETLSYLLRASGFVDVEIVYSSPIPESAKLQRVPVDDTTSPPLDGTGTGALLHAFNKNVDQLNNLIFADQDYAAVAKRP